MSGRGPLVNKNTNRGPNTASKGKQKKSTPAQRKKRVDKVNEAVENAKAQSRALEGTYFQLLELILTTCC
jgi:hypothetical protein